MPDTKITALAAITTVAPANDLFAIVDVSDNSMAASGTTKNITTNQILGAGGTATLASATITGDLTAARLIVTGATVPTNGMYLPSANTLAWAINSSEGMRLNATGLGVGQSPSDKFNVRVTPASGSFGGMTVNDATNAVGLFITGSAYNSFGVGANSGWVYAATNNLAIGPFGAGYVSIVSNGSERMRVDTSGNVGIGVTPSAWATYKAVSVGGIGASVFGLGSSQAGVAQGAFFNNGAGSGWAYSATSQVPTYYLQINGENIWNIAASGTAGAQITAWTPAMKLDASGNLLVAATSSSLTTGTGFKVLSNSGTTLVGTVGASSSDVDTTYRLYSSTASAYRFYVGYGGTVYATNTTISAISDARLKENVQDIDVGLGAILALKPRKFDWKTGKGKDIKGDRGFIAQEFETVFPQLVDEWADPAPEGEAPYKSVRQDLIPVLVKAIQELAAEVNALKNA